MMEFWQVIGLAVVGASVSAAVLLYMFARALNIASLLNIAKRELIESISSGILILWLVAIIPQLAVMEKGVMGDLFKQMFKKTGYPWYAVTDWQTGQTTFVPITDQLFSPHSQETPASLVVLYLKAYLTGMEAIGQTLYTIDGIFRSFGPGFAGVSPFMNTEKASGGALFTSFISVLDSLLKNLYFLYLYHRLLIYLILFGDAFALNVLLPAGLVLRAFPPTRGLGAFLISWGIGLYLVFPISYALVAFTTTDWSYYHSWFVIPPMPEWNAMFGAGYLSWAEAYLLAFKSQMQALVSNLTVLVDVLLRNVCLLPFVAIALTLTVVHALSILLEANIPEIGRGLIKFL